MKLRNIVSIVFMLAAHSVFAAGVSPKASIPEQGARVGLAAALGVVAAVIENSGCSLGFYNMNIDVEADGSAITTFDGTTLVGNIDAHSAKGFLWNVTGSGIFRTVPVSDFVARYGTDYEGVMLYGRSDMLLSGVDYGEHIIEDFWVKDPTNQNNEDIRGDGLEIITKLNYPRSKWIQDSFYHRPNGGDGIINISATQIAPDSTSLCSLTYSALVDDFAQGWVTRGGILIVVPQVAAQQ